MVTLPNDTLLGLNNFGDMTLADARAEYKKARKCDDDVRVVYAARVESEEAAEPYHPSLTVKNEEGVTLAIYVTAGRDGGCGKKGCDGVHNPICPTCDKALGIIVDDSVSALTGEVDAGSEPDRDEDDEEDEMDNEHDVASEIPADEVEALDTDDEALIEGFLFDHALQYDGDGYSNEEMADYCTFILSVLKPATNYEDAQSLLMEAADRLRHVALSFGRLAYSRETLDELTDHNDDEDTRRRILRALAAGMSIERERQNAEHQHEHQHHHHDHDVDADDDDLADEQEADIVTSDCEIEHAALDIGLLSDHDKPHGHVIEPDQELPPAQWYIYGRLGAPVNARETTMPLQIVIPSDDDFETTMALGLEAIKQDILHEFYISDVDDEVEPGHLRMTFEVDQFRQFIATNEFDD